MTEAIEYSRAQQLRQRQNSARASEQTGSTGTQQNRTKEISLMEAGLLATFLALIFDIPAYVIGPVPFIGWILALFLLLFGKLIALLWIACKGHLNFGIIKRSGWSLALSSSAFIISFMIQERAEKILKKQLPV